MKSSDGEAQRSRTAGHNKTIDQRPSIPLLIGVEETGGIHPSGTENMEKLPSVPEGFFVMELLYFSHAL